MKNVKFFIPIFSIIIITASCATTQRGYDDDYGDNTRRVGNRVYVDDPYYGTVILERDAFTGRYYDVSSGYRGFGSPYNGYNRYRGGGYYRNYPVYRNPSANIPRPVPNQRPQVTPQNRQEARDKVLGNKKS